MDMLCLCSSTASSAVHSRSFTSNPEKIKGFRGVALNRVKGGRGGEDLGLVPELSAISRARQVEYGLLCKLFIVSSIHIIYSN